LENDLILCRLGRWGFFVFILGGSGRWDDDVWSMEYGARGSLGREFMVDLGEPRTQWFFFLVG
jgi:hypothetical protein